MLLFLLCSLYKADIVLWSYFFNHLFSLLLMFRYVTFWIFFNTPCLWSCSSQIYANYSLQGQDYFTVSPHHCYIFPVSDLKTSHCTVYSDIVYYLQRVITSLCMWVCPCCICTVFFLSVSNVFVCCFFFL